MKLSLREIADLVGGQLTGDPDLIITGVNGIREARDGDITFIRSRRYREYLGETSASAVLVEKTDPACPVAQIAVPHPDLAFARILQHCETGQRRHPSGIHETAVLAENARIGENTAIGAHAIIGDNVIIGNGTVIYPGVFIGPATVIGCGCVIYPNAAIREETAIGNRVIIHANAAIGSDGFGFAPLEGRWMKIPQAGRVIIGDDVEIGSNTAIDRATFGETRIGNGTKIDNLVQIGHNVWIGDHCVIAGKAGIAGSAHIGNHVRIGADAGIAGHIDIGDGAAIGARAGVTASIEAGATVSGFPAIDHTLERRVLVAQKKTPELFRRVKRLERELETLREAADDTSENDS
jgi:UDP-3-O-[3-hydroxymyristoyl] glucosamine N-acyltransferase